MVITFYARADRRLEIIRNPAAVVNCPSFAGIYAGQEGDHRGTLCRIERDSVYNGMLCRVEAETSRGALYFDVVESSFWLPGELTRSGALKVQLVFTSQEGTVVAKTQTARLKLERSVMAYDEEADSAVIDNLSRLISKFFAALRSNGHSVDFLNLAGTALASMPLPEGTPGRDGQDGKSPYIGLGNHWFVWDGERWEDSGVSADGRIGEPGPPGAAATVEVGSTATLAAGNAATVANRGDASAAVLDFGIPAGRDGLDGQPGSPGKDGTSISINGEFATYEEFIAAHPSGTAGEHYIVGGDLFAWDDTAGAWFSVGHIQGQAATVAVGTVTTLPAGSAATVSNTGTTAAAIFNFGIPTGQTGATGTTGLTGPEGPAGQSVGVAALADQAAWEALVTAGTADPNTVYVWGDGVIESW